MAGIRIALLGCALGALLNGPGQPAAERPLPFFYDLYTFRGEGGATTVVGAFAVEAGNLETEEVDGFVRYRFSVTLALADTVRRSVFNTHDTVFVNVPGRIPDEHLLYTHVEVLAPPSSTTRHRVIMIDATTPGIGQLYSETLDIPDYSGHDLMLSDIAFGQPGGRTGWRRRHASLALLPTSRFPSSAFDVYYEIYNLPARHAYTTAIAIQPLPDPDRPQRLMDPIELRFTDESLASADRVQAELRRIETSLGRGRYDLTVTVTDQVTYRSASRSRSFEVRRDGAGAIMVPALPTQRGNRR